jgi:hypothetical protein
MKNIICLDGIFFLSAFSSERKMYHFSFFTYALKTSCDMANASPLCFMFSSDFFFFVLANNGMSQMIVERML